MLSSHIVSELERVCDHLVILAEGGVRLAGPIEPVCASHRLLIGPRRDAGTVARRLDVVEARHSERQTTLLVRGNGETSATGWISEDVGLEEIVLAYLARRPGPQPLEPVGQARP